MEMVSAFTLSDDAVEANVTFAKRLILGNDCGEDLERSRLIIGNMSHSQKSRARSKQRCAPSAAYYVRGSFLRGLPGSPGKAPITETPAPSTSSDKSPPAPPPTDEA